MSERDIKQALCYSIEEILKGIEKFHSAAAQQSKSGDWDGEHLNRIEVVDRDLFAIAQKLRRLAHQTW